MAHTPDPVVGSAVAGLSRLAEMAFEEATITPTQYRLLQHLAEGRTIQSDLAFRLSISKQSVTRVVDTLVDLGCITRREDRADRRRVIHAITPKGRRVLAKTNATLERYLMLVLQDLDDDTDIEAVRAGLRLFSLAGHRSYTRVRPDGIVPGRLSRGLAPSAQALGAESAPVTS